RAVLPPHPRRYAHEGRASRRGISGSRPPGGNGVRPRARTGRDVAPMWRTRVRHGPVRVQRGNDVLAARADATVLRSGAEEAAVGGLTRGRRRERRRRGSLEEPEGSQPEPRAGADPDATQAGAAADARTRATWTATVGVMPFDAGG